MSAQRLRRLAPATASGFSWFNCANSLLLVILKATPCNRPAVRTRFVRSGSSGVAEVRLLASGGCGASKEAVCQLRSPPFSGFAFLRGGRP